MPKIKLIVEGGNMQPGPVVAQQLGSIGINLGKVINDINQATSGFKGIKVPVELDVNSKTKSYNITVLSPPVAELIKNSLQIEKGSGQPKTIKAGNIAFETLVGIAKTKMPNLLAKDLKSALKLIVGTCVSLGVLIDNKEPFEIQIEIDSGKYNKEIEDEITEVSEEKKEKLQKFFEVRKAKQERDLKAAEEAAKAAEEAAAQKPEKVEEEKKEEPKAQASKEAKKEEKGKEKKEEWKKK